MLYNNTDTDYGNNGISYYAVDIQKVAKSAKDQTGGGKQKDQLVIINSVLLTSSVIEIIPPRLP